MSIVFNHADLNRYGISYSDTTELDPEDPDNDVSFITTITRVDTPVAPYYIAFTASFDDYGVAEEYFVVYEASSHFLARLFQDTDRLEGRTLRFNIKYTD